MSSGVSRWIISRNLIGTETNAIAARAMTNTGSSIASLVDPATADAATNHMSGAASAIDTSQFKGCGYAGLTSVITSRIDEATRTRRTSS